MTLALVEVTWVDSSSHAEWDTITEHRKHVSRDDGVRHRSVGYLLARNGVSVSITQSVAEGPETDTMVGDTLRIPRRSILKIRTIR